MPTSAASPRLLKGGLVLIDPASAAVRRVITLQYNPDSLSRSFEIRATGEGGDRSEALRLRGPPVETITLTAEIDATDGLEFPERNAAAAQFGIQPQLAALETILYPSSDQLLANDRLARAGTLEIAPMEAALTLFVWSRSRILPVRLTSLGVTEEAFDAALNPVRARVDLGMRVLSVDDLGFSHKGGSLFIGHLQLKERLAGRSGGGLLNALGIGGIP